MRVQIQAVEFTAGQHLIEFINKKIGKLDQYFDKIIDVQVFLRLDKKNSSVKDKVVTIKMKVPNNQVVATEVSKNFEKAVDLSVDSLRRQLKRYKGKMRGQ